MAQQGASSSGGGYTQARPAAQPAAKPAAAPGSKPPPGGTGGKRYVRTQAGANRFKKPIGAEILPPSRDARGAQAQGDKQATDQYKGLVSQDSNQQSAAMKALNDDQLKRLSEVAFSFNSSDANVARLRAGVSIEMQRRSLDVNRHGGLGGRGPAPKAQASTAGGGGVEVINYTTGERYRVNTPGEKKAAGKAQTVNNRDERLALHEAMMAEHKRQAEQLKAQRLAETARKAAERKAASDQAIKDRQAAALDRIRARNAGKYGKASGKTTKVIKLAQMTTEVRQQAADTGKALPGGRFPIRNVADLRNAIQAIGRANPADREKVARFICKRAKELNAEHLLGPGIRKLAGYAGSTNLSANIDPRVIELDGKWKHGWIPLDGAAVHAKTRGRQGAKPWWDKGSAGHHQAPGSGGSGGGAGKLVPKHTDGELNPKHEAGKLLPKHGPAGGTGNRTSVVKSGMTNANHPEFRKRYGHLSDQELQAAKLDARTRAQTDVSAQNELHMINREQDRRKSANQDVAKAPTPSGQVTSVQTTHKGGPAVPGTKRTHGVRVETISRDQHFGKGTASTFERQPGESADAYKTRMAAATTQTPATPAKPAASVPKSPLATATLGKRMAGSPEGLDVYPLKDTAGGNPLYDAAAYKDGQLVGFVKKRSGFSTVGRSGAATYSKNTGYSFYDAKGRRIGNASTRASALSSLRLGK